MERINNFVQTLQEGDRREIFPAAEFIRNPLPFVSGVVEIEHGSHGVHAQPVNVVLVEPEDGIRDQKILHFVAAVVEDQSAPIRMLSLARVGMLVEMGAIELSQAVAVTREMRGRPVQKNSNAGLVEPVDEVHEVLRRAVAAGCGEISESLVSPGAIERVLHYGHELDVRVTHLFYVGNQPVGKLGISKPACAFLDDAAPGTQMNLVD